MFLLQTLLRRYEHGLHTVVPVGCTKSTYKNQVTWKVSFKRVSTGGELEDPERSVLPGCKAGQAYFKAVQVSTTEFPPHFD